MRGGWSHLVSRRGGCWPSPAQRLLLEAALLPGERALAAYRRWRAVVDLDDIDPGSYRLLPLLAHNLADAADADLGRARGVLRHTWSRNQTLLARAAEIVTALQGAGIPVMVLKGGALAARCYASLGHRPMNDLDLLVPAPRAAEARAAVAAAGWRAAYHVVPGHLEFLHGMAYTDGHGHDIDLHWHALLECCGTDDDAAFWEHAEPLATRWFRALSPHPTELVLLVAAHGLRWSALPPLQWAADLHRLFAVDGARVEWARLLREAERTGLTLRLALTLSFVAEALAAPVPPEVLAALAGVRPGLAERLELRVRSSPPGLVPGLLAHWFDHRRLTRSVGTLRRLWTFPARLAAIWGLSSPAAVPAAALRRAAVRFRRRSTSKPTV